MTTITAKGFTFTREPTTYELPDSPPMHVGEDVALGGSLLAQVVAIDVYGTVYLGMTRSCG